jgi:hypothetical protein
MKVSTIFLLFLLSMTTAALVLAQGEEDDGSNLGPQSEKVEIPPETDMSIEIQSARGSILVNSDYTINVYGITKGNTHVGSSITKILCANTTKCCFEATETFILENQHVDVKVIAYYTRQMSCDNVSTGSIVAYFLIGALILMIVGGFVVICVANPSKFFHAPSNSSSSSSTNYTTVVQGDKLLDDNNVV